MAEFPALPLWTDAYLADTTHLSTVEHGAYLLLLIAMWRKRGELPNDDRLLAKYARLSGAQWGRIKPVLWPFFDVHEKVITQGRLSDEFNVVKRISRRNSDAAKARWLKYKETGDAGASPTQYRNDAPTPTPIKEKTTPSSFPPSKKKTRGSRLAPDWSLTDTQFSDAHNLGMTQQEIERETDRFRDYWIAKAGNGSTKLDWSATWRNWCRKAVEDRSQADRNGKGKSARIAGAVRQAGLKGQY